MKFKKITMLVAMGVLTITLSAGVVYAAAPNNSPSTVTKIDGAKHKGEKHRDCGADFAGILSMDAKALGQELKSGKTLAQIAAAKGMNANILTEKLQTKFNERIDKAVVDGKLTADKAVTMKGKTAEKVTSVINKSWTGHKGEAGKGSVFKNVRQEISAVLGMDATQLKDQLKSGKTLAQIAEEKKIAKADLVSKVQSIMKENLDQAVKDKKVTADKAIEIESRLPQMIERMITHVDKD